MAARRYESGYICISIVEIESFIAGAVCSAGERWQRRLHTTIMQGNPEFWNCLRNRKFCENRLDKNTQDASPEPFVNRGKGGKVTTPKESCV